MSSVENSGQHFDWKVVSGTSAEPATTDLSEKIAERIAFLEHGVQEAARTRGENEEIPDLEGTDNGLYPALVTVAESFGVRVDDSDENTKGILHSGRKGLHKRFSFGWAVLVKQGSPLQMAATLGHEFAHHFTPPITNEEEEALSETVAEGTAFVVCDQFGLDISSQAFPYIAGYNKGKFTNEMKAGIKAISSLIIQRLPNSPSKPGQVKS